MPNNPTTCHQKLIRDANLERDLVAFNLTQEEAEKIKITDFTFSLAETKEEKLAIDEYIKENEWLGTSGMRSKLKFAACYKGKLCGALIFTLPAAYSKMLGEDTKGKEILLARGACSSFTPVGLASCFIMWCIKYLVQTTDFRIFIGYSDPAAGEIGTIYQALNFYFLGQKFGTRYHLVDKRTGKAVSDRLFHIEESYKRYAKQAGIVWQNSWTNEKNNSMDWNNVPEDVANILKTMSKDDMASSERVEVDRKGKYVFVLGSDKAETRYLRKKFLELNNTEPYPKRG